MYKDEKSCPFCGEIIKQVAIKCKHCKSDLNKNNLSNSTKNSSYNQTRIKLRNISFFAVALLIGLGAIVLQKFYFKDSQLNFTGNEPKQSDKVLSEKMKNENSIKYQEFRVGQTIKIGYFQFQVTDFGFTNFIGNDYIKNKSGNGNKFLVIQVNIKNIDSETRFIDAGEVRTFYNGGWLKYETSEMVLDEKYILFDNLNPLTSRQGLVAFKVPVELDGPFYWVPSRSNVLIKLEK